mgnify:CR=1 FL=1|tara:strand:- start:25657 stop:25914 length:258 start_codon:yes stop_codon:yes gene_type:complete
MKVKTLNKNNTLITEDNERELLFSYDTCVAGRDRHGFFKTSTYFSRTTSKHINAYLDGRKARNISQSTLNKLLDNLPKSLFDLNK